MHKAAKLLWTAFGAVALFIGGTAYVLAGSPQTVNLPTTEAGYFQDADVPDVTARVARISFISNDAQIRRAGADEWERVTLNLPLVEGDEIVTEDSRVEIQFDNRTHLRLAENSYLKIVTLKDEGVAVSLSLGTFSVRITTFDKDKAFFEADAPKTTLAVQRAGTYRVDAGKEGDSEIRVSVADGGEVRVYSDNAGFTLKDGRNARVFIDGPNAGEWATADVAQYSDDFDGWTADRDSIIAQRLKDAHYDRYYDQDIYAADDLNGHGDWVFSVDYGYVWRPYGSSIARYANWSPYRYGHWRWMSPYGWVWVNDEPWGWATYHYGRWIFDSGYWVWSPYGYYRSSRSWWYPSLVAFNFYNGNICWYPLGYRHRYRNWNHNSNHGGNYNTGGVKPIPSNTPLNPNNFPTGGVKPIPPVKAGTGGIKPPLTDKVPPSGVVVVGIDEFGTTTKPFRTAPPSVAAAVLSTEPGDVRETILPLPAVQVRKKSKDIAAVRPAVAVRVDPTRVGAAPRKPDAPLDNELRTKRVFDGRTPIVGDTESAPVRQPRKTGAVDRPVIRQSDPPVRQSPVLVTPPMQSDESPQSPPVRVPRRDRTPVRSEPAPTQKPPRYVPPPVRERPRDTTPVRSAPPPTRQPKYEPPSPVKSEPKPESKPSKPREAVAD